MSARLASIPELLGHAFGRHVTPVRTIAGLALTIASLGMRCHGQAGLWRGPWNQREQARRRARIVLAAACLSPVAAVPIFVAVGGLYWCFKSTFE
jgi:hypothetical protein